LTQTDPPFLPYGRHQIDDDDVAAVVDVLRSGWLTTGPVLEKFEAAFAKRVGARFAVSCSSGTAGLHLASLAAGLGAGDTVIVPALTFLSTANAPRLTGAQVVFADVNADTALMGPAEFAAAIDRASDRIKAVFPVHYGGQCVDPAAIQQIAREQNMIVIEDACHSLGASYDAFSIGACTHSDMTVFSFHPVKAIAMGEGGMITTNDPALYERLCRFRNHGMVKAADQFDNPEMGLDETGAANPWYYEMPELGLNYRPSDINCALGLSQLAKLDRFLERRRSLAARYDERIKPLASLITPMPRAAGCKSAFHLYPVLIDFGAAKISRAELMRRLAGEGVGTQVHYLPVHLQPYYVAQYGVLSLPAAEAYYEKTLSLPLFPAMSDADIDRVVAALSYALGQAD